MNNLKIYKTNNGNYEAIRDSKLYSFMWNPSKYKVFNFKKEGKISPTTYSIKGKLIKNPHIQMILQVQNKINDKLVNESLEDVLKPKNEEDINKSLEKYYRGKGFYGIAIESYDETIEIILEPIKSFDEFYDIIDEIKEKFMKFADIYIFLIDTSKQNIINYYGDNEINFDKNIELLLTFKSEYY